MTLRTRIAQVQETNDLRMADWSRVLDLDLRLTGPCMTDDHYEHRLERRGTTYYLRRWGEDRETSAVYDEHEVPDWLRKIIEVARVAGAISVVGAPPPDELLWFTTTKPGELIEFINLTEKP